LNIKYEVYLDDNDQLAETKTKLSDSVSATFAVELSEKERSLGRNTQVSSVYINKDLEVEEKTTRRPPSTGITETSDSGSACIGPSCTTTIIVSTGDRPEDTVGEEDSRAMSTTGDPTTTEPDRLAAVAGYTCPSRHLSYAVLFAGLVFAH